MTKLPYVFDLLYDIKTLEQLYEFLNDESSICDDPKWQVEETMVENNIPFPDDYCTSLKPGFPTVIWMHKNGTRIDFQPPQMEEIEY